jgi:hypothetical protein
VFAASELLQVSIKTLYEKMQRYGISPEHTEIEDQTLFPWLGRAARGEAASFQSASPTASTDPLVDRYRSTEFNSKPNGPSNLGARVTLNLSHRQRD